MNPALDPHFGMPSPPPEMPSDAEIMLARAMEFNRHMMRDLFIAVAEALSLGEDGLTPQVLSELSVEVLPDGTDTVTYKNKPLLRAGPMEFGGRGDGLGVKVEVSRTIERLM